jgi:hypothetical protein
MAPVRPEDEDVLRRFAAWKHRRKGSAGDSVETASPQQVYADLMKSVFSPALREAGLRGSGGRFELPSATLWAQLGFQKSAYSDGQEVRFTVNLLSVRRDEWSAWASAEPHLGQQPSPTMHYGDWVEQTRIGHLTPQREDKWWRIVRGFAVEEVRDDAVHDLLTYAVPWLRARLV